MNEAKAKVIDAKARKASKIATMLTEFKTQPAEQVVAKNKVAFESAGVFSRSQGLKREIERAAFSLATLNRVCGLLQQQTYQMSW